MDSISFIARAVGNVEDTEKSDGNGDGGADDKGDAVIMMVRIIIIVLYVPVNNKDIDND